MILVDTSVWIDHLRQGDEGLSRLLNESRVLMHPFVLGELACGNLVNRQEVVALLGDLPRSEIASDDEVLFFIERKKLMARGLGYIAVHVLTAVALHGSGRLWTRDKRLHAVADSMRLVYAGD